MDGVLSDINRIFGARYVYLQLRERLLMKVKELDFPNKSAEKAFFKDLPQEHRNSFLAELMLIMQNEDPAMEIEHIAGTKGVIELKINGSPAWRCVYYNKDPEKVWVLHAFKKTTNGADKKNIDLAKERLKLI